MFLTINVQATFIPIGESMKKNSGFHKTAVVCAMIMLCATLSSAQNFTDVKPSPQQVAWQDLEIGAIIHFGPNTFLDQEWGDGTADPSVFNPPRVDPEQWMRAAKSAGIKYVVSWPSIMTVFACGRPRRPVTASSPVLGKQDREIWSEMLRSPPASMD